MQLIFTRKSRCKRIFSAITALIIVGSSIAGAVIIAPVSVFALSAGGIQSTIASIIISLMLQCGVAPVNNSWITSLNTSYGYTIESAIESGLLTETASGLIDSGLGASIEGAAAYTDLGLAEIFTTTASDVGVVAASGGANIAGTVINVGIFGTIGAYAGAVTVGVGVGILGAKIFDYVKEYVKNGLAIDSGKDALQYLQAGESIRYSFSVDGYYKRYYYFNSNYVTLLRYLNNNEYQMYAVNLLNNHSQQIRYRYYDKYGKFVSQSNETIYAYTGDGYNLTGTKAIGRSNNDSNIYLVDEQSLTENIGTWRETGAPKPVSPDIITPMGNAQVIQGPDGDEVINGQNNIIPEGYDMAPVDLNDYLNFAQNANNNTNNGDTGQAIQGEEFEDFISPYIVAQPTIPDTPIIPDQPVDVPTVPDRPVNPVQPTIPDKPGITQEDMNQALQGATTIDLRSIFPFCIPFDLYNLLLIFDTGENRKAPHITFTFPITGWVIDVDLVVFDPVAGILRLLELILFIIGLAVATRRLIGAGGG